jgi:4-amino-4-deoxy-L-arabinose transferase-like glycosyltransferase
MSLPPSKPDGAEHGSALHRLPSARRIPWDVLAVITGSLLFLALFYRFPISDSDEGTIAMGAERILRGEIPFRDFFSELGPASFYLQATVFRIMGESLTAIRLTAWGLGGILTGIIYLLAKRLISGAGALIPAAAFAVICYPYAYRISHHWWGNLFLFLSVFLLAAHTGRGFEIGNAAGRALLAAAGAFAALTLLAMQSKGVWAIVLAAAYLFLAGKVAQGHGWSMAARDGLKRNFWFLSPVAVVLMLTGSYFLAHGALAAWIEDNFLFLFTNYRPYLNVAPADPWSMVWDLARLVHREPSTHFVLYLPGYLFFAFIAPLAAFGGAAWRLRTDRHLDPPRRGTLLLFLLLGIAAFLSEMHSPDFTHLAWGAPLMLILLTYEWSRTLQAKRTAVRRLATAGAVFALLLMVFTGARKAASTVRTNAAVETRRGVLYVAPDVAERTRRIISAIQNAVPAGGETFFFPYQAEMYFLTATHNPTRYDVLLAEFHSPLQIEEAIETLRSRGPAHIFSFDAKARWTIRPHFPDDPPDIHGPHPVEEALRNPGSGYQKVTTVSDMEVWARKP